MSDFYVYAHYTLDTNEIFYIGKGKGDRAYQKGKKRNKYWHNIVKSHGYRIEILVDNLEEPDAFIQEILAIKEFKPKANLTIGGGGCSGHIKSKLEKSIISNRMMGYKNHRYGKKGTMLGKKQKKETVDKLEFKVYSKRRGKTLEQIYGKEKANNILKKCKNKIPWNKNLRMSEKHNEKLSSSHGIDHIYVYNKKNMDLVGIWSNMTKCSYDLGVNQPTISRYINGRNQFHKKNKCIYYFSKEKI